MATYENAELGAKFELPDRVSVRQQLAYYTLIHSTGSAFWFESMWDAAKTLIAGWECEHFPDFKVDLSTVHSKKITNTVIWAGTTTMTHITMLEQPDPN